MATAGELRTRRERWFHGSPAWSLTSLKEKPIKIGAKVVSYGNVAFQMAEVAISQHLFADILRLIAELRPPDMAPV